MKFINFLTVALFALTLAACGSDSANEEQTPVSTETTPAASDANTLTPINNSDNGALNPAHGEPGHRCDIAVGAPLNGEPAPAAATEAQKSPLIQTEAPAGATPLPTTTAQPVAEGMNPAHGQPGHRCDIAVGAPLNGTPKQ